MPLCMVPPGSFVEGETRSHLSSPCLWQLHIEGPARTMHALHVSEQWILCRPRNQLSLLLRNEDARFEWCQVVWRHWLGKEITLFWSRQGFPRTDVLSDISGCLPKKLIFSQSSFAPRELCRSRMFGFAQNSYVKSNIRKSLMKCSLVVWSGWGTD